MKKNRVIIIGLLLVSLLSDIIKEIIEKYFYQDHSMPSLIFIAIDAVIVISALVWTLKFYDGSVAIKTTISVYLLIGILEIVIDRYFLPKMPDVIELSMICTAVRIVLLLILMLLTVKSQQNDQNITNGNTEDE